MTNMTTDNKLQKTDYITPSGGIPVIVKVLSFMVLMVLVFTGIANLLPQVKGEAPKDIKVDLGALTMETYISMGEALFNGKGTCTLCHNNLGRAPDILAINMEETAIKHLSADDYKGAAKDSESYLHESMVAPSKYVVPGYGKAGEPSPMPAIDKAPIGLNELEMGAIIAFLQAKDGGEPTVELPTDAPPVAEVTVQQESAKPATSAEEVLVKNACTACHAVLDSPATLGPELHTIGSRSSREAIRDSIINPSAVIAKGFPPIMPGDFADKMMVKELEMVVDFLLASKELASKDSAKPGSNSDATVTDNAQDHVTETEKKGE